MGLVGQTAAVVCAKHMGAVAHSKVSKILRRVKRFSMKVSQIILSVPKTVEQSA
jgi:hypothetical protein